MALPSNFKELSSKEQEKLGLPDGYKVFTAFPFDGMDQSNSRTGMADKDFFYVENFTRLGDGNYRTLWDQGSPLYTAPTGKTIIYFYFYNIGLTNYVAVFLSDGTAIQVDTSTGANTTISAAANTFYDSSISPQIPCASQWGSQYLLIANNFTNDSYWVWDGGLLYTAGSLAPQVTLTSTGSNYTSAPTVTAYGGNGSGATFTATVSGGEVVSIQVTNPGTGYEPGDNPQLYITGGGSDSNAELTAVLSAGAVTGVVITDAGLGYDNGTWNLIFTGGGGSSAAGTYTVSGGTVTGTTITNGGSGYTGTPTVTFPTPISSTLTISNVGTGYTPGTYALGFSGGSGTGAAGTYTIGISGSITSYTISNNGSGYTSAPTVSFPSGGGSSAAATASLYGSGAAGISVIASGAIASVTVVHGGTNFTSTPTLTVVGGGGINAALTAVLTSGVISSVTVTNGGTGYTSAPAIEVESGTNNSATATVTLMPYGISGSSIETFQSRVWICYPNQVGTNPTSGVFNVSAPGSFSVFATSAGGLTFTSTDSFLKAQYSNIKQSNGYLYPFGDSSVSVISNVQTSFDSTTNTSSTTFNYQNTDPQIGTSWRDTCVPYSRTVLFANPLGVFGLYGGAVTKVSGKIDQIFTNVISPANGGLTPSAAIANMFSKKIFALLMTFKDPFTQAPVNKMVCWDEKEWFIASQASGLIQIGTQEVDSNLYAWGTDGTNLYPMFNTSSASITKKMSTKLFGVQDSVIKKQAYNFMFQGQDMSSTKSGITLNVNIDTNYLNPETGLYTYPLPEPISISANPPTYPFVSTNSGDISGMNIGTTFTSNSLDFVVNFVGIGYTNIVAETGINEGG